MQVVVDSLLTSYQIRGEGKVVVLVHGWGETAQDFTNLQESLSSEYKVVNLDLPGFGQAQPPPTTWGLDDYASFIASFLKKINENPFAFVGHSNGGAIVMRGLSKNVLKAQKLVLLASSGIRDKYKGRIKAIRLATKTGKALTHPLPTSVKKRLRRKVYSTVGSDMLVVEHLQDTFKKVVTDDVQADAAELKLPTLLIYGDKDSATPLAYGQRFHELIKGSKFEAITGAGHFIQQDEPTVVESKIKEFLG